MRRGLHRSPRASETARRSGSASSAALASTAERRGTCTSPTDQPPGSGSWASGTDTGRCFAGRGGLVALVQPERVPESVHGVDAGADDQPARSKPPTSSIAAMRTDNVRRAEPFSGASVDGSLVAGQPQVCVPVVSVCAAWYVTGPNACRRDYDARASRTIAAIDCCHETLPQARSA